MAELIPDGFSQADGEPVPGTRFDVRYCMYDVSMIELYALEDPGMS